MEHATHTHDEEQYFVHSPKEVMQILTELMKQKVTLRVSFNHGLDEYFTTVIGTDVQNHAIYLDIGRDEAFNRRLLASQHVLFSKDDGIKIKWVSTQVSEVALKDGQAIAIEIPQNLIRLQRRDSFHFPTPSVNPAPCVIPLPEERGNLVLALLDVSLGGIGTIGACPLDPAIVIGANFDSCKINFPEVGETNLTLQVRNITQIITKNDVIKCRIGFQFIAPSRGNEGLINRYVSILERQTIALANRAR
ncbi:MAG: flagellar brake protein [Methylophilaceae bacterium]|nr:flagellar brake protein [Methylophilaceae bacterium]